MEIFLWVFQIIGIQLLQIIFIIATKVIITAFPIVIKVLVHQNVLKNILPAEVNVLIKVMELNLFQWIALQIV